jgi:LIVCS family branched-chain amino acid:cation transporter
LIALLFSLKPSKIIVWVGKLINPLFLVFLAILLGAAAAGPMGIVAQPLPQGLYKTQSFFKGFTEGYNTMDALASLAFGIIVAKTLHGMGVKSPAGIAKGTLKAGIVSVILMSIIYSALTWMGTASLGKLTISPNGGLALAQIANYYFGSVGAVLLAIIVTLACLKTAIGLITACSQTFEELFPGKIQYRGYVFIFTGVAFLVANMGLTQIITLAIPILMFLYPLAITLILLTFFSASFGTHTCVYRWTTALAAAAALGDALNALPAGAKGLGFVQNLLELYKQLPFFSLGMGWVLPSLAGFIIGLILRKKQKAVS